ncbi:MAG: F390 synthetase-related protein [Limnohabitans sp.]|jgi:putative adenylate-forming enzyme
MSRLFWLLLAYLNAKRLHFTQRHELEQHQRRALARFMNTLCQRSPYFAAFRGLPLSAWPTMDKSLMMAHFEAMNTAKLHLPDVMAAAMRAEVQRDFSPDLDTVQGQVTVGLSSGTTSQRGAFVVSARERAQWAGIMLAKALPRGLLAGERAALFLRANSNLYTSVRHRWLALEFFDLFAPFNDHLPRLTSYQPTVLIAPAQVLRALALAHLGGKIQLTPHRVISVAEVLEPQDRQLIESVFAQAVHEIYQATEGFLASTCEHGVLHLNEEYLHVEPEWLDAAHTRFVPIITDFSRLTQPIVRYRLNDVLVRRESPCICGRASLALERIEGRCDDQLLLPACTGTDAPVFADVLTRTFARLLPLQADYRLLQSGRSTLALHAEMTPLQLGQLRDGLIQVLSDQGIDTTQLTWTLSTQLPEFDPTQKRRRIVRTPAAGLLSA